MNKKVAILGGGTGLPQLLKGLKYVKGIDITAIVTISDNGGSTGVLSEQYKIPAVGDLRRVIAALSTERIELEEIMNHRFSGSNSDLDGHTLGNLIITTSILQKGNFAEGIENVSDMLNVEGKVLPVSNQFYNINAELNDGSIVHGEENVSHSGKGINKLFLDEGSKANPRAIQALEEADYIIFGIGSLYTSLIANLVYPEVQRVLHETEGKVFYFANVFTQHGETDGMKLSDHIKAVENHTHEGVIDEVFVSSTPLSEEVLKTYEEDGQFLVDLDVDATKVDLISVNPHNVDDKLDAKHDEHKIKLLMERILR